MKRKMRLVKTSRNFAPVPFWFLDHDLEDKELIWQIRQMKDKGLSGFFIVPWDGLTIPYLSEKWFDKVEIILKEARNLDLKAWIYDTLYFPSGEAGGKVAFDHPEYTQRYLKIVEEKVEGKQNLRMKLPDGKVIKVVALKLKNGKIDIAKKAIDITDNVGIIKDKWQCRLEKAADTAYGPFYSLSDIYPHWRAKQTEHFNQLNWDVPSGEWLVMAFVECFGYGRVDLLNPDAVKYFIEVTHEQYWKRFKSYFGNTIPGFFADEPKLTLWTPNLLKVFKDEKKYNLEDYLPALKYDIGDTTSKIRCDYREVLLKLFKESYVKQIYDWCDKHDVEFTGHLSPEEEPICAAYVLGDLMSILKSFHIPGTDALFHFTGDKEHAIRNIGPKLVSSVAHQTGKERVICEAFALINWEDMTLAKMKEITDWLFVLGINMLAPHAFYYSIDGYRKKIAPSSHFYQSTYWTYYKVFSDYVSRLGVALTGGEHVADIAMIYPTSTLWSLLPCDIKSPIPEQTFFIRDYLILLNDTLLRIHRDFDYLDEKTLADGIIKNGKIIIGKGTYSILVLPPLETISKETLKRIKEFYEQGGILLAFEFLPFNSTEKGRDVSLEKEISEIFGYNFQETNKKKIRIFQNSNKNGGKAFLFVGGMNNQKLLKDKIKTVLEQCSVADVRIESSGKSTEDIFYLHRVKEGQDIYFFVNISDDLHKTRIFFKKSEGEPYLWNPGSNSEIIFPLKYINNGRACIEYTFEKREALFVIFGKKEPNKLPTSFSNKISSKDYKEIILSSEWKFETEKQNVFLLQNWSAKKDNNKKEKNKLYETKFYVDGKISKARLIMDRSVREEKNNIWINGILLNKFKRVREYDVYNISVEIQDYLKASPSMPNIVTVEVNVSEDDGLWEPIMIMGDFTITSSGNLLKAFHKRDKQAIKSISWTQQGYPYYSGTGRYEQYFNIGSGYKDKKILLVFEQVADMVEVLVNDRTAGVLCWPPYRIKISEFLKDGENKLKLKITNSMANMLEGKKKKSGLIGKVKLIVYEKGYR